MKVIQPQAHPGKKPLCFRSEERFLCRQIQCPLRRECMKLVARWRS